MMADPSHTRQAHTGRPPRACPVQLLVIPRPDPLGTGRQARSATTFTRLYRRERLALNLTHQARTGWPGDAEKLSDRSRFRPASLIWPTRPTGSSRRRDALEVRNGNNQSVPSRLRYNAELSCGARLSDHDDASFESNSPGAHMAVLKAPSAAAPRYTAAQFAKGWVGRLVAQPLPRGSPCGSDLHVSSTIQARACWPWSRTARSRPLARQFRYRELTNAPDSWLVTARRAP
jgi:hypothetical protein